MYNCQEIRWFTKERNESIISWFAKKGLRFQYAEKRTDQYLIIPDNEEISTKLREGNIEIKHRTGKSKISTLTTGIKGNLENWTKWSFKLDDLDPLSNEIIIGKQAHHWIEVHKKRMGLKIVKKPDGNLEFKSIHSFVESGCQIEYTELIIKDQLWYSFNLEWYGSDYIEFDPSFYSKLFGESKMELKDSSGYARFLKSID